MISHSQIVQSVAYALAHLDDEGRLESTTLVSLVIVQNRIRECPSLEKGKVIRQILSETIDNLLGSDALSLHEPVSQYLDLRYRQGLAMKEIVRRMGYSREYITRRYRRAALHRITTALVDLPN